MSGLLGCPFASPVQRPIHTAASRRGSCRPSAERDPPTISLPLRARSGEWYGLPNALLDRRTGRRAPVGGSVEASGYATSREDRSGGTGGSEASGSHGIDLEGIREAISRGLADRNRRSSFWHSVEGQRGAAVWSSVGASSADAGAGVGVRGEAMGRGGLGRMASGVGGMDDTESGVGSLGEGEDGEEAENSDGGSAPAGGTG